MPRPRIAIIDDHALVRSGLAHAVTQGVGAEVVWEGKDPRDVLDIDPLPDLVLLDLDLGDTAADPEVAARLQRRGCQVLVVSALADPRHVQAMIDIGVAGFVSKREPAGTLMEAIRSVLDQGTWTSPEVAAVILSSPQPPALSATQHRVLVLYASGMTMDSVARHLGISVGTANTHLKRARAKYAELGRPTPGRVDLYREAVRDGLIPP